MIPKIIHYCWFGGKPLPEDAREYIETWKKFCPDYEIKEWNESNFDIDHYPFTREAYDAGKYAFVADVARLHALHEYGGIYLDTDVELLKSFDPFLRHQAFTGFEDATHLTTGIMASEKGGRWIKENLDYYRDRRFIKTDGTQDTLPNPEIITEHIRKKGLLFNNSYQEIKNVVSVYPKDYFCPKSHVSGKTDITPNTVAIHYFAGSWLSEIEAKAMEFSRYLTWIPASKRIYVSKFLAFISVEGLYAALRQTWNRITR